MAKNNVTAISGSQHTALEHAAHWYALLCAGEFNASDKQAWQQWRAASHQNRWAWQQVEVLQQQLAPVADELSLQTFDDLDQQISLSRRAILRSLLMGISVSGISAVSWYGHQQGTFEFALADTHTNTGEVKTITLPDGTLVTLDTASSINFHISASERRITLRQGQIMVQTASLTSPQMSTSTQAFTKTQPPLFVDSPHGQMQALGTRFSVRLFDQHTQLNVYQHSVRITNTVGQQVLCPAQYSVNFTDQIINQPINSLEQQSWTKNMLVVNSMPLPDFIAELNRYRLGILRCDADLQQMKMSGAFNTLKTAEALQAVENAFPVKVTFISRYWGKVSAKK